MSRIVGLYLCKTCNEIYFHPPNMESDNNINDEEPGHIPDAYFLDPNYTARYVDKIVYVEVVHGALVHRFYKSFFLICGDCNKKYKITMNIMELVGFQYHPSEKNLN